MDRKDRVSRRQEKEDEVEANLKTEGAKGVLGRIMMRTQEKEGTSAALETLRGAQRKKGEGIRLLQSSPKGGAGQRPHRRGKKL